MQKKILYLHGLNGSLSVEKREILERYFKLVAPQLDYMHIPDVFAYLSKLFIAENIEAVIGNSMGGCFAYYLSLYHSVPALCFNPALGYHPTEIEVPELKQNDNPIVFVIGGKDTVVPSERNFAWIRQNPNQNFILKWYNEMEHRIDAGTFEKEAESFAKTVCHPLFFNASR
jgi:pimeloyl-ACP methyl ester carboxylesterase